MPTPIRVLHVIPQIGIGGAETQLHALIVNSDPADMVHEVLYYSDSLDEVGYQLYESAGIQYTRIPRSKMRPVRFIRAMAHDMRRYQADVVHCWLLGGTVWGRLAAIVAGARCIIVSHRGIELVGVGRLRWLERFTGHRVNYLANSRAVARIVAQALGLRAAQFEVIYNGAAPDAFVCRTEKRVVRQQLGIQDDVRLVMSVGRLTPAKNYPMMLRVMRRLRDAQQPVVLAVIGHGELESEIRAGVRELGLEDRVFLLGLRRDVAQALAAADLFCFTSNREGFPNAVLEAMMTGLPIVTTDFPGVEELIASGVSGLVVPRDDDGAMAAAIQRCLGDAALSVNLGRQARQTAHERFGMSRMVSDTLNYYRRLLGPGRAAAAIAGEV